jgi:hypothetical protein
MLSMILHRQAIYDHFVALQPDLKLLLTYQSFV